VIEEVSDMAVTVYIPTPFRRATQNRDRVVTEAGDVAELLDRLEAAYAGLRELVRDGEGHLHHHINIYVNSEAIEDLGGLEAPLRDGDEVAIIPALAGGGAVAIIPALAGGGAVAIIPALAGGGA
jgi:molybdopterin converting factor small subunit